MIEKLTILIEKKILMDPLTTNNAIYRDLLSLSAQLKKCIRS